MDPSKLPPLRAGLGTGGVAAESAEVQATKCRLVATVAVMTQKAGMMALQLATHESREQVCADDINRALKHQARYFLQTVDSPEVVEDILAMERAIFGSDDDGSGSESLDSSGLGSGSESLSQGSGSDEAPPAMFAPDDAAGEAMRETKNVVDGACVCPDCVCVRGAVASWDSWAPEDEAEKYLRNSVNMAIAAAGNRVPAADDM
jgi:hypothetical protein